MDLLIHYICNYVFYEICIYTSIIYSGINIFDITVLKNCNNGHICSYILNHQQSRYKKRHVILTQTKTTIHLSGKNYLTI